MDIRQRQVLEDFWRSISKPTIMQRERLALELGLEPREIQAWFQERRAQTKARKHLDEMKTLMALEAASELSMDEAGLVSMQQESRNRALQTDASYASLHRSIAAAAACMPLDVSPMQESHATFTTSMPHVPSTDSLHDPAYYGWSGPSDASFSTTGYDLSKTASTSSDSSTRTGPGAHQGLNIDLLPMAAGAWPVSAGLVEPTFDEPDFLPPMRSVEPPRARIPAALKIEAPKPVGMKRPSLQRTNTCPATLQQMPSAGGSSKTQPLRMRRRAKLPAALGVGMCRSQSSLGDDAGADRRLSSLEFAPYPSTPLRRVSSSYGFTASPGLMSPSVGEYNMKLPYSATEMHFPFPASPISPEQLGAEATAAAAAVAAATPIRRPVGALSRHNSARDPSSVTMRSPFTGTPPMTPIMPVGAISAFGGSDPFLCHEPMPVMSTLDEHDFLAELSAVGL